MAKPRALSPEQHRELAERHLMYVKLRVEAAKHSPYQLAKEFGVHETTLRNYLERVPEYEGREDNGL